MERIQIFLIGLVISFSATDADESLDTREGVDLTLKCRFTQHYGSNDFSFYWARWTTNPVQFENVAIGDVQLNSNYRLFFQPDRGIYDLQIKNSSYNRDNGRFECRIKAKGTGADVHQEFYNLTVLTPPHPPLVSPGNIAIATENKPLELTCGSIGGSPDPSLAWYREGSTVPLQALVQKGGTKNIPTNATLSIVPRRADDGAKYKCVVWNRAMPEGHRLETTVVLNVNYYPRVDVGPVNPLRIERERSARLECIVDAKPKVSNVRWTRNGRFISSSLVHTIPRVNLHDAGRYTCAADNGLEKIGEKEIVLEVLYSPIVVIESKTREAEEGEMVSIKCNTTANPSPIKVEWLKEGNPQFRYNGDVLVLNSVRAEHAGNYICRAVNLVQSYNSKRFERVGNSTVALLVRHRPGQAYITPNKPVVHVGNGVTLSCSADPPGWPVPQYRWFRDIDGEVTNTQKILAQGSQYSIPKAHLGNEGKYHCHAVNELGIGKMATIVLEIHQPPQFLAKLQQHMTRRVGDTDYVVTCSAKGKPAPTIRWLKDGVEISAQLNMFDIKTRVDERINAMLTVQSMLRFRGKARPNGNQLVATDRGIYTCLYENDVNSANSSMNLKIEHEPIVLHRYNKVAYDLRDVAEVVCRVQAYPKPEFQWQFGSNPTQLPTSSEGHYSITTTTDSNDVYTSVLRISHLTASDYGEYKCHVMNFLDTISTSIRLQPKGAPEKPTNLKGIEVAYNSATLTWDPGFNGGYSNTKYLVSYRPVAIISREEESISDCANFLAPSSPQSWSGISEWREFNCFYETPCKVAPLDQHQSYAFKVHALNAKGISSYSNEIIAMTKVSKIPPPLHVTFDPTSRRLGISIDATCLTLTAVVESLNKESPLTAWEVVDTLSLQLSANKPTIKEAIVEQLITPRRSTSSRPMGFNEDKTLALAEDDTHNPTVRVKLCLRTDHKNCGDYTIAEIGRLHISQTSSIIASTVIAVVSCILFVSFVGITLMLCHCKRTLLTRKSSVVKDYETESVCPSTIIGGQQSQAPPPYYPTSGPENKAIETSMDLTLSIDDDKSTTLYATPNGYTFHHHPDAAMQNHCNATGVQMPRKTIKENEWSHTDYNEKSYFNSTNSVRCEDNNSVHTPISLWQVKMSPVPSSLSCHSYLERSQIQPSVGVYGSSYDSLPHAVYGVVDDYNAYTQLAPATTKTLSNDVADDNDSTQRRRNPSRQQNDSPSDSYASVHRSKKRNDYPLEDINEDSTLQSNTPIIQHIKM